MILAIDAGNTRCKWALFDAKASMVAEGCWVNDELAEQALPACWHEAKRIVVSNVAGMAASRPLLGMFQHLHAPVHWVHASHGAAGVINGYQPPEALGSDRWAALIAAWQHYQAPCLVVSAGTALTVDMLSRHEQPSGGEFKGGTISPGFRLMHQSLLQNTEGIRTLPGMWRTAPTNTGDALYTGISHAMAGSVLLQWQQMKAMPGNDTDAIIPCVLTGGDVELLRQALVQAQPDLPVTIDPSLVLRGLFYLERECL
ncbi:type III pantothenate kinase [Methylovorus mays]|uniref:type III pantothenate kinase n=1 Tax=Methylovorus mays TaxID=184077 RepID=UPI001E547CA8|nr:type III pantothenate kinase [Methylovorus mays]MCB5207607.1 type III pantothenate kinase [Methylovorus mays]